MKSLVSAGYGAAILPLEQDLHDTPVPATIALRPLTPPLWRSLGLAHRPATLLGGATLEVLRWLDTLAHATE